MNNLKYVYTYIYGVVPKMIQNIIQHNMQICKDNDLEFKVLNFYVEPGECICGASDWFRIEHASQNKNVMYVDWDCRIEKFPVFDPLVPMMTMVYKPKCSYTDMWAFYNGDRTDLFKTGLETMREVKGQFASYDKFKNIYSSQFKYFEQNELTHMDFGSGRIKRPIEKK